MVAGRTSRFSLPRPRPPHDSCASSAGTVRCPVGNAPRRLGRPMIATLLVACARLGIQPGDPRARRGAARPSGTTGTGGTAGATRPGRTTGTTRPGRTTGTGGPAGPRGAEGPAGPQGIRGPSGAQGESGVIGGYVRSSILLTIPAGSDGSVFAACDEGDLATGGGFSTLGEPGTLDLYEARPDDPAESATDGLVRSAAPPVCLQGGGDQRHLARWPAPGLGDVPGPRALMVPPCQTESASAER